MVLGQEEGEHRSSPGLSEPYRQPPFLILLAFLRMFWDSYYCIDSIQEASRISLIKVFSRKSMRERQLLKHQNNT